MITVSWSASKGWAAPKVVPYGPISLMPSSSVLHYATECFEGMKLFRGHDGHLRLFRPGYNCERMLASATRVSLPAFDPEELRKLVHRICALEGPKWLPKDQPGSSLYIRPAMIGSDSSLGFKVPSEALLYVFLIFWPTPKPRVMEGTGKKQGVRLLASRPAAVRAWPGGTGAAKVGANYGPAISEHADAKTRGFDQVLYLHGPERQITEAGVTNFFIIRRSTEGVLQIVTPPLDDDNLILAGNTRRSILELSREMFGVGKPGDVERCDVLEGKITMAEIQRLVDEERLMSVFITGTAYSVQEVSEISLGDEVIRIEMERVPHVAILRERVAGIMFGREESDWAEVVDED